MLSVECWVLCVLARRRTSVMGRQRPRTWVDVPAHAHAARHDHAARDWLRRARSLPRSAKEKRLRMSCDIRSQFLGVGVRHALFPGGTRLDALAFAGGVLPDATLRGMRMFRSHGGTVLTVAGRDLLSEASAPGSDAPCRERRAGRGADTPATFVFCASSPLSRGRRRLLTGRWPRVTGLTS